MFWIPARVQHFVKIHDKSLNLTGMTSCGTACKALGYIYNGLMIHTLLLSVYILGHVAQGFNPAKADCDTASCAGMTFITYRGLT